MARLGPLPARRGPRGGAVRAPPRPGARPRAPARSSASRSAGTAARPTRSPSGCSTRGSSSRCWPSPSSPAGCPGGAADRWSTAGSSASGFRSWPGSSSRTSSSWHPGRGTTSRSCSTGGSGRRRSWPWRSPPSGAGAGAGSRATPRGWRRQGRSSSSSWPGASTCGASSAAEASTGEFDADGVAFSERIRATVPGTRPRAPRADLEPARLPDGTAVAARVPWLDLVPRPALRATASATSGSCTRAARTRCGSFASTGCEYVEVTPIERGMLEVNDALFAGFPLVAEVGDYRLYRVPR